MDAFRRDPELAYLGEDRHGETRWSTESLRRLEATAIARAENGAEDRTHALAPAQTEPILRARPHLNANYALCGWALNRNMMAASRAKTWTRRPRKERTLLAHSMPVFS